MLKAIALSICATLYSWAWCQAADAADGAATSMSAPPDFESLRVKGLNVALPGPRDTIDSDFAGIRSGLASIGMGYIGYTNNSFFNNLLPAEHTIFGQQVYNGQKPTLLSNNVMLLTYDLRVCPESTL